MYIRNLRKPSPNKNVFKFASTKVSSVVMCESSLEFDACFHHEYNDLIESFGSQPEGFKYEFMGKSLPYTPDALISYTDKTQKYHEYKTYSKIASPLFRAEFAAKRAASLKLGIDLVLVTDRQIRVNPILNNLKLLHRYSGVYGISGVQKELLSFIHKSGVIKLNDISSQLGIPIGETRSLLLGLMHKGLVKADLGCDDLTNNPTLWATPGSGSGKRTADGSEFESPKKKRKVGSGSGGMTDFFNEFDESLVPLKPQTPTQYVKLDDANLIQRDLDTFSDTSKNQALQRYKLISTIDKKLSRGWTQRNLDPILDELFKGGDVVRPNWRTVARWRKKYIESNGDIASLADKNHKMGNRTNRIKGDDKFFDKALERFLDAKRPTIATAYQYYKDLIVIENESIVEGKIPIISYNAFNKRIKAIPPYAVAVARHGKFKADQWFAYCAAHVPPTRILERVEIDHTPLDLILLDDELLIPIGRPYLTLLIDVFSGCVLGFHLSYKSPSYVSAAKAITHAIKPKSLDALNIELQNDWPCFGKFENLVVDNGAEFWSKNLEHACQSAGINIQYNPVRKPWLKPFIERFFGVMNENFLTELPGKTFSNILEKEEYKPEKDAIMRFSTFVEEFHRWIVDVYHQNSNSRETRIPIKRWKQGFDAYPPLTMNEEEETRFSMLMRISDSRTLTRNGFKYQELMYDSTALADYRKRYPQTKETVKKLIKVDPDDISKIYVYLEELESYLEVPCTDPTGYTDGLSIYEHKTIKKINREEIRESKDSLGLAKARMAIHERVKREQEVFIESKTKAKITAVKKQAQIADVSNTGTSTIKVSEESAAPVLKHISNDNSDDWDDDLEAFE